MVPLDHQFTSMSKTRPASSRQSLTVTLVSSNQPLSSSIQVPFPSPQGWGWGAVVSAEHPPADAAMITEAKTATFHFTVHFLHTRISMARPAEASTVANCSTVSGVAVNGNPPNCDTSSTHESCVSMNSRSSCFVASTYASAS